MREGDAQILSDEEAAQGWAPTLEKHRNRLKDQSEGKAVSLVAEYRGEVAGYINVYPHGQDGPFSSKNWPEIVDFGVLEKYRRHGIGSILMDTAERIAAEYAAVVYLGVGLHSGYGSAQRMYVKRGYIPDGSGLWYRDRQCQPYAPCRNDDDLVLYFSKKIK